jgi:nucleoside-diphosphate-sugar epimerase
MINNEGDLEERLSRPSARDVEAMAALEGDILVLGASGKMGPSLCKLARRASDEAGIQKRVIAVARYSDPDARRDLEHAGVDTIPSDLLESGALGALPDAPNVVYMAARKFGTTGAEHLTWAINTFLPGLVAERYRDSRIVAFSTGNVYPLRPAVAGGATETSPLDPQGEYAQSALGRERLFEYGSHRWGTRVALIRLNYAVDLRYGVLVDIAQKVSSGTPVDLRMGLVNVIWQGDANSAVLRAFEHCSSPPLILNITGPETLSVREIASEFGRRFGREPMFQGDEAPTALLSNAAAAHRLLGYPTVSAAELIDWVAAWLQSGGRVLNKPTHFQTRDGKF